MLDSRNAASSIAVIGATYFLTSILVSWLMVGVDGGAIQFAGGAAIALSGLVMLVGLRKSAAGRPVALMVATAVPYFVASALVSQWQGILDFETLSFALLASCALSGFLSTLEGLNPPRPATTLAEAVPAV